MIAVLFSSSSLIIVMLVTVQLPIVVNFLFSAICRYQSALLAVRYRIEGNVFKRQRPREGCTALQMAN